MTRIGFSTFPEIYFNVFVIFLCVLELLNMDFMDSSLNLIICIPELVFVLFLLISNSLKRAFLFHVVFSLTTFSPSFALRRASFLSYSGLKLFGPFTIAYIILGLIWLLTLKYAIQAPRYSLLFKTRRICIILLLVASLFSFIGVLVFNYSFIDIVGPLLYMGICVIYLDIFVRLYEPLFLRTCYFIAIAIIVSSPITTFISYYLFHISASYSVFDAFVTNESFVLTPLLILFILRPLPRRMMLCLYISLFCYFLLVFESGRGGSFLGIAISVLFFAYLLYFTDSPNKRMSIFKVLFPIIAVLFGGYLISLSANSYVSLGSTKLKQFLSLFSAFSGGGISMENLSNSPYMRIAEFLNVFESELHNPFLLLFGKGYGGTYTDGLGLFEGIDLSAGSFSEEAAAKGVFATAHSMYPNVLLFHGLIGLVMVIKLGVDYLKKIKYSPLVFAAFSLFLYSMYFNNLLLLACLFVLFASEYSLNYYDK